MNRLGRPRTLNYEKTCQVCGSQWIATTRYQATRNKTCSKACAAQAIGGPRPHLRKPPNAKCSVCGQMFFRNAKLLARTAEPACSKSCNGKNRARELVKHSANMKGRKREPRYGSENPAWKGGVMYRKRRGNYVSVRYIRAPAWALPMARQDGYVMEHRLVMARLCRRILVRAETVHHRNHDPLDNRPENLELWPTNSAHKRGERGRFAIGVANRWSPMASVLP